MSMHLVSISRVTNGDIAGAVEEAVDLLGGIAPLTEGHERIMLKPNLVTPQVDCTTKVPVVETLARLMQRAGKDVMIGEGSAAAAGFNLFAQDADAPPEVCKTRNRETLDAMQQFVFETLGYRELAERLNVPLVSLHSDHVVEVPLDPGHIANSVRIHRILTEIDLVCSVPMMKTHLLAGVTLAMKNLVGLYPGTEYYAVRSYLHDQGAAAGSKGTAFEVLDINSAVQTGFSMIDASTAMEGNGPVDGTLVDMGLIVAGTSPLATDMVGAALMGFRLDEIPAIALAYETGMAPASLEEIEIRGLSLEQCIRKFARAELLQWDDIRGFFGAIEV